jgi:hypothetical protein
VTSLEVELLAQDPNNPQGSPGGQPAQNPKKSGTGGKGSSGSGSGGKGQPKKDTKNSRAVVDEVALRLAGQIGRAIKEGSSSSGVEFSFGYQRQFEEALRKDEIENPTGVVVSVYDFTKAWLSDLPWSYLQDQPNVGELVKNTMQARLEEVVDV